MADHKQIFSAQYTDDSGPGSKLDSTRAYRHFLSKFIDDKLITSITDLGCGDMAVMSAVDLHGASYLGIDVIPERITMNARQHPGKLFAIGDVRRADIGVNAVHAFDVDLVICKDVIQHWATEEIHAWLDLLMERPFKYALITNCNYGPTVNTEIETGGWRAIDLTAPPFSIGEVVFTWTYNGATKDVVLLKGGNTSL